MAKLFRYRKPSWKTVLGITKAKKKLNKDLGITAAMKPFRWWGNQERKVKRQLGYYTPAGKLARNGLSTPGGCCLVVVAGSTLLLVGTVIWEGLSLPWALCSSMTSPSSA